MTTEQILKVIKERRSIFPKDFDGRIITKQEIKILLEAANWAPTHRMTEPWRFHVLGGKRKKEFGKFLAKKTGNKSSKEKVELSDKILLLCFTNSRKSVPKWEELAAFSMAVQNAWLVCKSLQIGGYWSSPEYAKDVDEFTKPIDGSVCKGFFYLGKYDYKKTPKSHRSDVEKKIKWEIE